MKSIIIFTIGCLCFAIAFIRDNSFSTENYGKKALINGVDTCYIVAQERGGIFHFGQLRERVSYRDRIGIWHVETFNAKAIVIIE